MFSKLIKALRKPFTRNNTHRNPPPPVAAAEPKKTDDVVMLDNPAYENNISEAGSGQSSKITSIKSISTSESSSQSNKASVKTISSESESSRRSNRASIRSLRTVQINLPIYTIDEFNREIFFAYSIYTQNELSGKKRQIEPLTKHALLALIACYEHQYNNLSIHEKDPHAKYYYSMHLLTMCEWTTVDGFKALMNAIHYLQNNISGSLHFNLEKNQINAPNESLQHLLNWLAIVCKKYYAGESPEAMSFALKIMMLTKDPFHDIQDEANPQKIMRACIRLIDDFKIFFLGEKESTVSGRQCIAGININAQQQNELNSQLSELFLAMRENNQEIFSEHLQKIRHVFFNIYNELAMLISLDSHNHLDALNMLLSEPPPEQELKLSELEKTWQFVTLAKQSETMTKSSYEPLLIHFDEKEFYFTPYEWSILSKPVKKSGIKLSISQDNLATVEQTETDPDQLGEGSSNHVTKLHLIGKRRARTNPNNSSGITENSNQVAATPVENNESLISTSTRLQLIDKSRLNTL